MKAQKINILVIEESGNGMKAVCLPNTLLLGLLLFIILTAVCLAWILCDYRILKPRMAELTRAENVSFHQKTQIAYLSQRIQDIHRKLVELDQYDLKLRTVAHIATGDEGGSLLGVGGSDPGGSYNRMNKSGAGLMGPEEAQAVKLVGSAPMEEQNEIRKFLRSESPFACSKRTQWPAKGWVCSKFGVRSGILGEEQEFNKGIDIATKENAPVHAPEDGVVTSVEWREGYGRRVVLAHGLGLVSVFSHLDEVLVSRGERLRQGDIVATAGGTGKSTGPYVHYEIHLYGVPVDPQQCLRSFLQ